MATRDDEHNEAAAVGSNSVFPAYSTLPPTPINAVTTDAEHRVFISSQFEFEYDVIVI